MTERVSTSKKIVNEILDKGLRNSAWREAHPTAFEALLEYREDLECSARDILIKNHKQLIKSLEDI